MQRTHSDHPQFHEQSIYSVSARVLGSRPANPHTSKRNVTPVPGLQYHWILRNGTHWAESSCTIGYT
jgi:hypothetical protein